MNIADIFMWRESLASCAIEGNQYAIEMLKLYDEDREAFILELYRLQLKTNGDDIVLDEKRSKIHKLRVKYEGDYNYTECEIVVDKQYTSTDNENVTCRKCIKAIKKEMIK